MFLSGAAEAFSEMSESSLEPTGGSAWIFGCISEPVCTNWVPGLTTRI